jgi:ParB family chromosome partitioning protein
MGKPVRDMAQALNEALQDSDAGASTPGARGALVKLMVDLPDQTQRFWDRRMNEASPLDGALPVRSLAASCVHPSAWANRHASAFERPRYLALKEEIRSAGGNIQPIKVRRLATASPIPTALAPTALNGATDAAAEGMAPERHYEIVYGHRRHRACLELGLPVLAMIEDLDDAQLFAEMDRENRQRENLSPWEQGVVYARALDQGLFPSMRQLADRVGCDPATVSRTIALARLPEEIVSLFASPTELQTRWAKPLSDLVEQHAMVVAIDHVRVRLSACPQMSSAEIYEALIEGRAPRYRRFNPKPETATLCHGGRRIGEVLQDAKLGTTVRFYERLSLPMFSAVTQSIQRALDKF